jgi:hypothetical protein
MLRIIISGEEFFDEVTETFSTVGDFVLELEHSLVSLSKWESEFQKPFLSSTDKTTEEIFSYVKAMIVTFDYPSDILYRFSQDNITQINEYIDSKQSATTFGNMPKATGRSETVTSELIYYWMVAFNIPFECETWHLNRLFSLIRICNVKNSKPQKMSSREIAARNRELNAQRRAQLGTNG